MARQPSVSIVVPAYNAGAYLAQAMDDLLGQTLTDHELIVVNDASTDGTAAILDGYTARDDRVRVLTNEANRKLPGTLNRGIAAARAPLIARADADDRYPPGRLAKQVALLRERPEVGLVSSDVCRIDEAGRTIGHTRFPTQDGAIRMRELFVNSFSHPAAMYRTDLVRGVGGYDEAYWTAQDADLWRRLRQRTRAANVPEPLVRWRVHGGSISATRGEAGEAVSLEVRRLALSDYLAREVSSEEAEAAVRCFRDRPHRRPTPAQVARGTAVLREVRRTARSREDAETIRWFDRAVARALVSQNWLRGPGERRTKARLVAEALRWSPHAVGACYREIRAA